MRLERHEGDVSLTDKKGKDRPLKEDLRFQDGDELGTGEESLAGISLDDTKAALLDANSTAEFFQGEKGDWIEIDLTEGNLFFNVKEKLEEDEEFEIHTSNMVLGIRGTSGYVTENDAGDESIIVTDGTVHLTGTNPDTGEEKEIDVSPGNKATAHLYDSETNSIAIELEEIHEWDLPPLVLKALDEDEELKQRVLDATGWDENGLGLLNDTTWRGEYYRIMLDTSKSDPEARFNIHDVDKNGTPELFIYPNITISTQSTTNDTLTALINDGSYKPGNAIMLSVSGTDILHYEFEDADEVLVPHDRSGYIAKRKYDGNRDHQYLYSYSSSNLSLAHEGYVVMEEIQYIDGEFDGYTFGDTYVDGQAVSTQTYKDLMELNSDGSKVILGRHSGKPFPKSLEILTDYN